MPQITSTTSHTVWSPCSRYCGGQMTPKMTPDTRFCSRLPPLWCLDRPMSKIVSPIFLVETLEIHACGERCKPVAFCSQILSQRAGCSMFTWGPSFMMWSWGTSPSPPGCSLLSSATPEASLSRSTASPMEQRASLYKCSLTPMLSWNMYVNWQFKLCLCCLLTCFQ